MTPAAARGLLDTSVFIALESGRPMNVERLPDQSVICPVTIAELQAGVLIAADVDIRARRLATLESTADIEVLAIDAEVAAEWGRLRVLLAESGRRVNVNDLWIAATAAAHGLPVVTQDDDFDPLHDVTGFDVIRV
jgi:predicted nucleic acid-binding protein